jgi:alkylhydroperoxidase/carboxymuconolactone decarboxylase family protein YurZ
MRPSEPGGAVDYLSGHSHDAANAHRLLRKAVLTSGPLDAVTCELIVLAGFVTSRIESGFKAHARRMLNEGVPTAAIRQAVLVTLGATATFPLVIEALRWVDEIVEPREPV